MASKKLSILFFKDGFSFCVIKDNQLAKVEAIDFEPSNNVSLVNTLNNAFQSQLYLQQKYDAVEVAYLGNQFNIVPNEYFEQDNDAQKWLEFNAEVYENDLVEKCIIENTNAQLVYAFPKEILDFVQEKFGVNTVNSASVLFLKSVQSNDIDPKVFLNIHKKQLEISVFNNGKFIFYNLFDIQTREDIVYYVLNVLKQLDLNSNEVELYYFGWFESDANLKMLMNFVRHVMPGTSDVHLMENYSLIQNLA